jgi:Fe2+ or Zn2+ uptake regulation protein
MGREDEKFEWALEYCRERGLRRTHALREILRHLLRVNQPVSWATLAKEPAMRACCDPSSIFRILVKLEELGLVRRMGSPERSYYFMLNLPGEHHEHLICTGCGKIENLDLECPVESLEGRVQATTGYRSIYHELDFFGVCPACQGA